MGGLEGDEWCEGRCEGGDEWFGGRWVFWREMGGVKGDVRVGMSGDLGD